MQDRSHRSDLRSIAHRVMLDRGFLPDFEPRTIAEVSGLTPPEAHGGPIREMTDLLWFSVDNDDSRDLDQISYADQSNGHVRLRVGIADVDALVKKGSAVDDHARHNTTSVYTSGGVFPMLPEKLSYDLTSLNPHEERLAIVVEMVMADDGTIVTSDVYRARVKNQAQLAYDAVGAWLEGRGAMPERMAAVPGLAEQVRLQNDVAQKMKARRHENGALDLQTIEAKPVFSGAEIVDLVAQQPNQAKELIENLMVAANGVTARYLEAKHFPSLRRVVRSPERWQKIVDVAAQYDTTLPSGPDSKALSDFLSERRKADPLRFPDLSLVIVKLMGAGEYVVDPPGQEAPGHFGLAVRDYTHSTAPNRRFPDLITQRLLKAAVAGAPVPYDDGDLGGLAVHCTQKEDDANKVERRLRKSAAALLLSSRIGDRFEGIVTGAGEKGTWVRVLAPPVEGKLVHGAENLDVGDRVRVKLIRTDVEEGFIDFVKAH
ncbi:MAG: RNB domain-containing ribonuclease [Thermoanaerobaculia bacterium]